jgi:hypothetical protein
MFDQSVHAIAGPGVRDVPDLGADIDHGVALQHAEPEIIEMEQLHRVFLTFLLPSLRPRRPLHCGGD